MMLDDGSQIPSLLILNPLLFDVFEVNLSVVKLLHSLLLGLELLLFLCVLNHLLLRVVEHHQIPHVDLWRSTIVVLISACWIPLLLALSQVVVDLLRHHAIL